MIITGCTISNNSEFNGTGGGGVLNENGTMIITRCTISNNSAESGFGTDFARGGGILNDSGGSLNIANSTISGNSCAATDGDPFFSAFPYGGGGFKPRSPVISNFSIIPHSTSSP